MTVARPTSLNRMMSTSKTFASLLKARVRAKQGQPTTKPNLDPKEIPILAPGAAGIIELTLMKTSVDTSKAQANVASAKTFVTTVGDVGIKNDASKENKKLSEELDSINQTSKTSFANITATSEQITEATGARYITDNVGDRKLERKIEDDINELKKKTATLVQRATDVEKATESHSRIVYNAQPTDTKRDEMKIHKAETHEAFGARGTGAGHGG